MLRRSISQTTNRYKRKIDPGAKRCRLNAGERCWNKTI
ncbi:hypothetical protein I552_7591 [Mycobacterium xenopi 3993]|nr:hypothetical protein I552_7591 [Mycobacterium xenopi 3993]